MCRIFCVSTIVFSVLFLGCGPDEGEACSPSATLAAIDTLRIPLDEYTAQDLLYLSYVPEWGEAGQLAFLNEANEALYRYDISSGKTLGPQYFYFEGGKRVSDINEMFVFHPDTLLLLPSYGERALKVSPNGAFYGYVALPDAGTGVTSARPSGPGGHVSAGKLILRKDPSTYVAKDGSLPDNFAAVYDLTKQGAAKGLVLYGPAVFPKQASATEVSFTTALDEAKGELYVLLNRQADILFRVNINTGKSDTIHLPDCVDYPSLADIRALWKAAAQSEGAHPQILGQIPAVDDLFFDAKRQALHWVVLHPTHDESRKPLPLRYDLLSYDLQQKRMVRRAFPTGSAQLPGSLIWHDGNVLLNLDLDSHEEDTAQLVLFSLDF